jgi:S-adenosylmethionine:tRNA ribosyltransferase-isomerase
VRRATRTIAHRRFSDLPALLPPGTVLIRNNVSVLKARPLLPGRASDRRQGRCLPLRPTLDLLEWWCMLRPGKRAGDAAGFLVDGRRAVAVENAHGEYRVRFELPPGRDRAGPGRTSGALPLPPYTVEARKERGLAPTDDAERYQTVYADPGKATRAAAAPTAGLHFTPELLETLRTRGHEAFDLVLDVGPVRSNPSPRRSFVSHVMHSETIQTGAHPAGAPGATSWSGHRHHLRARERRRPAQVRGSSMRGTSSPRPSSLSSRGTASSAAANIS